MKPNWFQRTLCSILALVLVLGYVPVLSFAAAEDGLCAHHTEHTAECGYSEASEGSPCTHEHSDECWQSVTECTHVHDDTCGYVAAVEGHGCDCAPDENGEIVHTEGCGYVEAAAEIPCGHSCSEETGCVKQVIRCAHAHDDACGYAEAAPESPCTFVCEDCAEAEEETVPETTEEPVPETTEETTPEVPVESETVTETELPAQAPGEEEDTPQPISGSGVYINPMYAGLEGPDLGEVYPTAMLSDTDPYTSVDDLVIPLREVMCARVESVTFPLEIPASQVEDDGFMDSLGDVIDQAIAHTGVPTQGDYIRANYYGYRYSYEGYASSTTASLQVTYEFIYMDTAAQEDKMDAVVDELLVKLNPSGTDYQKICTIYDYITQNITYDYANLNDDSYLLKFSPYAALVNKTAVCQGYAGLLYRLSLEMGIDCRMITGIGNGGPHAWNIIRLEGKYYNADSTWDAGYTVYDWFLVTDGNFPDHTRESAFASKSFYAAYPMGTTNYTPSSTLATPVLKSVANAASGVTVKWNAVTGAAKYRVYYKAAGSTGNWVSAGDTTGTSKTVTGLTSGTKYSFTVRCVSADGKTTTSGYNTTGKSITRVAQPAVSRLTNTSTGVTVKWSAVSGAAKYRVYYKAAGSTGNWVNAGDTTGTSKTVTGLTSGTKYAFTLRAIAADNTLSSYNTTGKSTTWVAQPAVSSLTNTSTGVAVKWSAISGAAKYRVYYKAAGSTGNWVNAGDTTGTSKTVTGLTKGTKYAFTLRAIAADGTLSSYNTTGKSITWVGQLAAPVLKSVANTATGVTVKWGAVTGAEKYRVYYKAVGSTGNWISAGDTTGTSKTVTGLTSGTKYSFTVRCISADGKTTTSGYNTTGKSITWVAQPAISGLAPSVAEDDTLNITVNWDTVDGAAKYRVYYKTGSGSWINTGEVTGPGKTVTGLSFGTMYTFTLRAVAADGTLSSYDPEGRSIIVG